MTEVGIRALKQNASTVVARAAAGESVTITDRGRPVARMVPLAPSRIDDLYESGRVRRPLRSLNDLPPPVRRRRGQTSLSDQLEEMRQSERY